MLCESGKNGTIGATSPIKRADSTLLKPVSDLDSQPVLFIPDVYFGNLQRAGQVSDAVLRSKALLQSCHNKRLDYQSVQVFAVNTEEVSRDG